MLSRHKAKYPSAPLKSLDKLVHQVFEEFLATAGVSFDLTLLQDVGLDFLHRCLARLDFRADAGIPRGITLLYELGQTPIAANG